MLGLRLTALTLLVLVAGCENMSQSYPCDGDPKWLDHCEETDREDTDSADGNGNGGGNGGGGGNSGSNDSFGNPGNAKNVGRAGEKEDMGGFNSPAEGGPGVRGRSD